MPHGSGSLRQSDREDRRFGRLFRIVKRLRRRGRMAPKPPTLGKVLPPEGNEGVAGGKGVNTAATPLFPAPRPLLAPRPVRRSAAVGARNGRRSWCADSRRTETRGDGEDAHCPLRELTYGRTATARRQSAFYWPVPYTSQAINTLTITSARKESVRARTARVVSGRPRENFVLVPAPRTSAANLSASI